jgi:hypothetical protein
MGQLYFSLYKPHHATVEREAQRREIIRQPVHLVVSQRRDDSVRVGREPTEDGGARVHDEVLHAAEVVHGVDEVGHEVVAVVRVVGRALAAANTETQGHQTPQTNAMNKSK